MLQIRNNSALTTPVSIPATATQVPFDTTVVSTNDNSKLSNNFVNVVKTGLYKSSCTVTLYNAATNAATVTLSLYADNSPVAGGAVTTTIPASSYATLILPWETKVVSAQNSTATISWYLSGGAVQLSNASAIIFRQV